MGKKDLFCVLALSLLASFFSLLPTIWAWLQTPDGFWFSGFNFWFDPWDINTYFADIRQGILGHWLYQDPYRPERSTPLPIFTLYLFLGHLARIFNLPVPIVYHLASILLTIIFFFVLYIFLSLFLKERSWIFLSLVLIAFGGGIGWLFVSAGIYLQDIAFPDATVFQTLHLPNFVLDQALFLATLLFSFKNLFSKNMSFLLPAVLSGFFLSFVHPYSLVVAIVILIGFSLLYFWRRKSFPPSLRLLFQFLPWVIGLFLFYLLLRTTPFLDSKIITLKPTFATPPPSVLLLGYGLLTPLAVLGAINLWQQNSKEGLFLIAWLLSHFAILYLPVDFQRVLIKSFFIVFCLIAVFGLRKIKLISFWPVRFWLIFLVAFSQVFMLFYLLTLPDAGRKWLYLRQEEKQGFDFLLEKSKPGEIVLSAYPVSNYIPANTNNRVYFGYSVLDVSGKRENVSNFYSGRLSYSASQFLKQEKIDYVFWGPEEKSLGDFDLTKESYLEKIYQNGKVTVFKVK